MTARKNIQQWYHNCTGTCGTTVMLIHFVDKSLYHMLLISLCPPTLECTCLRFVLNSLPWLLCRNTTTSCLSLSFPYLLSITSYFWAWVGLNQRYLHINYVMICDDLVLESVIGIRNLYSPFNNKTNSQTLLISII